MKTSQPQRSAGAMLRSWFGGRQAQAPSAPSPEGKWFVMDGATARAVVEVRLQGDTLDAVIVQMLGAAGAPGRAAGMTIVHGMQRQADGLWMGGHILNPQNGQTYDCSIEVGADGTALNVRGYRRLPALGKTHIWKRTL